MYLHQTMVKDINTRQTDFETRFEPVAKKTLDYASKVELGPVYS
jgi:hypothetical protein